MKLIHCADIHLDSKLNSVFDNDKNRARERRNEILLSFLRMVDYAADNDISAVLICGDLFDSANVSATTAGTVRNCIESHPAIDFYYIRGNHDEDSFVAGLDRSLDNLYFFGDEWTEYSLGDLDRIHLYGVELRENNKGDIFSEFKPDSAFINLVMLHGQIGADSDKSAESIDLRQLAGKGIDYLALGHIHAYSRDGLDERGIYSYCGCLDPRGFDEPGVHGFVVLDVDEEHMNVRDEFVPFATKRVWELEADVTGRDDTAGVIDCIKHTLTTNRITGEDLVKVFLVGSFSVESEIDLKFVNVVFGGDYYAFRVEDRTRPYIDFEKYRYDESLKGEFVRLCMTENLDEQTRNEIIHLGLTAIFGGEME